MKIRFKITLKTKKKEYNYVFLKPTKKLILFFLRKINKIFQKPKRKGVIIQLLPTISSRDAIGNMTLELSNELLKRGIENYIVTENINIENHFDNFYNFGNFEFNKNDIVLCHFSIGWDKYKEFLKIKVKRRILIYHNITPPQFFKDDINAYNNCLKGLKQLKAIRKYFKYCIADSEFNKNDLISNGYKNITVIPCLHKLDNLLMNKAEKKEREDKTILISVGRIARNKKIEDIIKSYFSYFNLNNNSVLYLIGSIFDKPYYENLLDIVKTNNLQNNVIFLNSITDKELSYYYSVADGYICMSEHEGFCVPLIEAMAFNIPIFAYSSTAVKETLGNSGVLFESKNFENIGIAIHKTLSDENCINQIVSLEKSRLEYFEFNKNVNKYISYINNNNYVKENNDIPLYYQAYLYYRKNSNLNFPVSLYEYLHNQNVMNFDVSILHTFPEKFCYKIKNVLRGL